MTPVTLCCHSAAGPLLIKEIKTESSETLPFLVALVLVVRDTIPAVVQSYFKIPEINKTIHNLSV